MLMNCQYEGVDDHKREGSGLVQMADELVEKTLSYKLYYLIAYVRFWPTLLLVTR
jgi:hypothetical protein